MRWIAIIVLIGCGGTPARAPENGAEPTGSFFTEKGGPASDRRFKEGPGGFPLPSDATGCQDMPNKDLTCKIPRKRDVVHAELVEYIKSRGMVVASQQMLAGGYRMEITSPSQNYLVSVTDNDGSSSLMTITVK